MGFDLGRSPPAALAALRYVEDVAHRVKKLVRRPGADTDPVTWLIRTHRGIHRDGDGKALRRGYEVAERMHRGQLRKSGEAYISHPLAVAQILAELGMDTTTLVAALLHDTVEDTSYTMAELRSDFGGEVAVLVDGVTKFDRGYYGDTAEVETIRKMLVAAGVDVRVLIVKLADRLHNMRTIDSRSAASRARIARATLEVLIPLCDRLGIQALKRELEDSVFAALEPEAHAILRSYVAHRPGWTAYTDQFIGQASAVLKGAKIGGRVVARPRHLYTVWKDTVAQGLSTPYELPRVAIIVSGMENDCYTALGAVHSTWRPVAGRFKDFIASPKNNLYRSLHTTVIGPDSQPVEVLIRTESMHRDAEYGIAASFRFARKGPGAHSARARTGARARIGTRATADDRTTADDRATAAARTRARATTMAGTSGGATPGALVHIPAQRSGSNHLDWLHRLLEWQRDAVDPLRFIESLRCDLAEGQVHVFVEGQRLLLPAHSTPVDVAYALSSEVGDRCVAATVNGQLVFLSSPLADGDVVEIHTADEPGPDDPPVGPSAEWLSFVRTPNAQLHIEARLGLRDAPETAPPVPFAARVRIGRAAIRLELRRRERGLASDMPLMSLADEMGYPDLESLLVAVADHAVSAGTVADRLIERVDSGAVEAAVAAVTATRKP
jgi:GTP pyrophosphokinase